MVYKVAESKNKDSILSYKSFAILGNQVSLFLWFDPFLKAFLIPWKHKMVKGNLNKKEKTKTETKRSDHERL